MKEKLDNENYCQCECTIGNEGGMNYCRRCSISTEIGSHTRRCFMTGEYCSQQMNIQKERDRINSENKICAFVVMNFSDMSDVVYKWKIHTFVESLKKYLYLDKKNRRLYCYAAENDVKKNESGKYCIGKNEVEEIEGIEVIRADSDPASNYVVCSRICQQMQIADLIIVDVSNQNPNVFYELGIAVALEKFILPMCYSESFYKRVIPEKLNRIFVDGEDYEKKSLKSHIGLYPWRKKLYEYYGIYYKHEEFETKYIDYKWASNEKYGFSDVEYSRFPYHERISNIMVGEKIYNLLRDSYNKIPESENTLIVYTMEGLLNEGEAGKCIVNYYLSVTYRMKKEHCFCGERVGVLAQSNFISENDKDTQEEVDIPYNIGEIIRTGVNQATYLSAIEQIHADDVLEASQEINKESQKRDMCEPTEEQKEAIIIHVKDFIRNKGMIIYPNNPVYVERLKNFLHKDLLQIHNEDTRCWISGIFCFYHVMLRTLRYVNEIVVDITNTDHCLQSLFWLGVAHGAGVYAITVKYEPPKRFRGQADEGLYNNNRNIFDVAGLWTAIYYTHNTDLFYKQLAMAQKGIERHSRLMLPDSKSREKEIREYISTELKTSLYKKEDFLESRIKEIIKKQYIEEKRILESFYRKKFWSQMLRYNRLRLYISNYNDKNIVDSEPRIRVAKWDFDAVSELTHYLSKRSAIGEYKVISLQENDADTTADEVNFLCVGKPVKPTGKTLVEEIYNQKIAEKLIIHKAVILPNNEYDNNNGCKLQKFKGFEVYPPKDLNPNGLFTQHPLSKCAKCTRANTNDGDMHDKAIKIYYSVDDTWGTDCTISSSAIHTELAQIILWRTKQTSSEDIHFRVSLVGSSGPATLALSMLLVEENTRPNTDDGAIEYQGRKKKKTYKNQKIKKTELLCELQLIARTKVMELYNEKLEENFNGIKWKIDDGNGNLKEIDYDDSQIRRYFGLVKFSTNQYLSTVLYRYFLPFLSEQDIGRIKNGMWTFISAMNSARISPFASNYPSNGDPTFEGAIANENIEEIAKAIPDIIEKVLDDFRGMEVFYQVKVQHREEEKGIDNYKDNEDSREIKSIELLDVQQNIFFFIAS